MTTPDSNPPGDAPARAPQDSAVTPAVSHPTERRAAAIGALLCGVLATLMLLTTIVTNPLATAMSVAGLAVAVASGWVALTNRGQKRAVAVVVGVLGLFVLLLAVIDDEEHRFFVIVAVLLSFAAVSAGRFALGRPPRRAPADELVGPAQRPALIVNPRSGDGRAAQLDLIGKARAKGIRVYELDGSVPFLELVHQAIDDGADALGAAGGDGSLAAVANLAAAHDIDFVCIPAGTRNHFALDLGLDRSDPLAALAAFGEAHRRRIDIGEVNGRPFLNNVSLGLYGEIVQSDGYRGDKWGTTFARLPDLVTATPDELDLRYTGPDGVERIDAQVIHVSNNPYVLSGPGAGTRVRLDSGVLGIVCARLDGLRAAEVLARTVVGGNSDTLRSWTGPEFEVRSDRPIAAGVDGEAVTFDPPVRFRVRPAAVWVRLPDSAPGESPAAQSHGYRWTVRELLRRALLPASAWDADRPADGT